jgi:hypothetical protein
VPLSRLRNKKLVKTNHKYKENEIWKEIYPRIFSLIEMNKRTRKRFGAIFGLDRQILSIIAAMMYNPIAPLPTLGNEVHFLKRRIF